MSDQIFVASVPADSRYLKAIRAFFQNILREFFGPQTDMVILALDESCSNVLKHREKGREGEPLQIKVEAGAAHVRFSIVDFCCAEDVPRIKPRDLKVVRPGGLGTHFIEEIMDRIEYRPDPEKPGRMFLVLEKSFAKQSGTHGQ